MDRWSEYHFYSGGLKGAETVFGENAEKYGISETTFSFNGHKVMREKNLMVLTEEELRKGDISMEIVSQRMDRRYSQTVNIRKIFQVIFHIVNKGYQVFAVGWIQEDKTIMGGTGWAVELAKFFNRPVSVFDQAKNGWYSWIDGRWTEDLPVISHKSFCGTGTRNLSDEGKTAIEELFRRSFQ